MKYFKKAALTAAEMGDNRAIATAYVQWVLEPVAVPNTPNPELENFARSAAEFIIEMASENRILLQELLGNSAALFSQNSRLNPNPLVKAFFQFITESLRRQELPQTLAELKALPGSNFRPKLDELREAAKLEEKHTEALSTQTLQNPNQSQSLAQELVTRGCVTVNAMAYEADIGLALRELQDEKSEAPRHVHIGVGVQRLYDDKFLAPIADVVKNLKQKADHEQIGQQYFGVTSNGHAHFNYFKIGVHPGNKIEIFLEDSKDAPTGSDPRQQANAKILENLKKVVTDAGCTVFNPNVKPNYLSEQGDDPNCAYYAIRSVARSARDFGAPQLHKNSEILAAAAENKTITDLKIAVVKNSVRMLADSNPAVRTINAAAIRSDEFGIVFADAQNPLYKGHRQALIETGQARRVDTEVKKQPQPEKKMSEHKVVSPTHATQSPKAQSPKTEYKMSPLDELCRRNFEAEALQKIEAKNTAELEQLVQDSEHEVEKARIRAGKTTLPVEVKTSAPPSPRNNYKTLRDQTLFGIKIPHVPDHSKHAHQINSDALYARILQNQELLKYFNSEVEAKNSPRTPSNRRR